MILVGSGGNTIRAGRFVRYARNTPLKNLWRRCSTELIPSC